MVRDHEAAARRRQVKSPEATKVQILFASGEPVFPTAMHRGEELACWVYVLRSRVNGRLYVGMTSRLRRRLAEHNNGHNRSTSAWRPWDLIRRESFADYAQARERERFLKSGQGRAIVASLGATQARFDKPG